MAQRRANEERKQKLALAAVDQEIANAEEEAASATARVEELRKKKGL